MRLRKKNEFNHAAQIMLVWKRQEVCCTTKERGEEYQEKLYPSLVSKKLEGSNWVYKYRIPAGLSHSKLMGSLDDIEFSLKSEIIFKMLENDYRAHFSITILAGHLLSFINYSDEALLTPPRFKPNRSQLWVPIGWSRRGLEWIDLASNNSPHLLIGGGTGAGKSILGRLILTCLHIRYTRDDCRLWLADLKHGNGTSLLGDYPRLVDRKIEGPDQVESMMDELAVEIGRRYRLFKKFKCDDLQAYNEEYPEDRLPRIVCYVDEVSKLEGKVYQTAREKMTWVTGEARGAGIHVILSCHRPTHDIISGTLKNNIPAVVAFRCNSVSAQVLLGKDDAKAAGAIDKDVEGRALLSFKDHVLVQVPYISNKVVKTIMANYQKTPEHTVEAETIPVMTSTKLLK